MSEVLLHYHKVDPTTWVYLASLLIIGLYFKFGRFWSVRNLDLVLLILLAPGLIMAQFGAEARQLAMLDAQTAGRVPQQESAPGPASAAPVDLRRVAPPTSDAPAGNSPAAENVAPASGLASQTSQTDSPEVAESTAGSELPWELRLRQSLAIERIGYLWLFGVGALLLIRLLLDPTMVRRPMLEPNLNAGGLTFIGCSLFVFLMANVLVSRPAKPEPVTVSATPQVAVAAPQADTVSHQPRGPGYALLNLIPSIPTNPLVPAAVTGTPADFSHMLVAKTIVILCHLAVVLGIAAIGYWHFGNTKTGVGMAALYLMLPYTAQMTGCIDHVLPAAVLVWAVLGYRRPLTSGLLIGLATSLVYYPLFLLPLWISFYWRRGLMRFLAGVVAMLVLMAVSLAFIPHASYWQNLKQMLGLWLPIQQGLEGIWGLGWNPVYRIPVLAAFVALSGTLAIWPAQKNLGTLLSCSAAVMVATQFWHGWGGGLYMAWYLPLCLLTVFRPNLEDRVALAVLGTGWNVTRIVNVANGFKAA
jgi:hypothetical protein